MKKVEHIKSRLSPEAYYTQIFGKYSRPNAMGWANVFALCPFHADNRAGSLSINLKNGAFCCFSCGVKGGDIIAFHQRMNEVTFLETLEELEAML